MNKAGVTMLNVEQIARRGCRQIADRGYVLHRDAMPTPAPAASWPMSLWSLEQYLGTLAKDVDEK